jgi:hypothetical protein
MIPTGNLYTYTRGCEFESVIPANNVFSYNLSERERRGAMAAAIFKGDDLA